MDGSHLNTLDRATFINGVTSDVHNTAEGSRANGDLDGVAGIKNLTATDKTFGTYPGSSASGPLMMVVVNGGGCRRDDGGVTSRFNSPSIAMHRTMFSPRC